MTDGPVLAADGTPLKRSLARALRREKFRAFMLVAPLLIFILASIIAFATVGCLAILITQLAKAGWTGAGNQEGWALLALLSPSSRH